MPSKDELEDYSIGRIWDWISPSSKKSSNPKTVPDVVLPWGSLKENEKSTLPGIGGLFRWTALLENGDLVVGPEMLSGEDTESKNQAGIDLKEFRADMIFLKKAVTHGTINLREFPRMKRSRNETSSSV